MRDTYARAWSTIGIVVVVIAILALIGCVSWEPANGAWYTFTNRTRVPVTLLVEDAQRDVVRDGTSVRVSRIWNRGVILPGKSQFFQWPWQAGRGRWSVVVGPDTTFSPWVNVWEPMQTWVEILSNTFSVRTEAR